MDQDTSSYGQQRSRSKSRLPQDVRKYHELAEAKAMRRSLQDKLNFVSEQISSLRQLPKSVSAARSGPRIYPNPIDWGSNSQETGPTDTNSTLGPGHPSKSSEISLIRKLRKEKETRHANVLKSEERKRQLSLKQRENSLRRMKDLESARKETKMQILRKREEELEIRKAQRQVQLAESEARLRTVKKEKLRYKEMEERYRNQVEIPLQKQKQSLLREKQALRSPMDLAAIKNHARSFDSLIQKRNHHTKEILASKRKELQQLQESQAFYRPKAAAFVEAEIRAKKTAAVERSESAKEKLIRKQRYAVLVRHLFPPKVSELKRLEMEMNQNRFSQVKLKTVRKVSEYCWKPSVPRQKRSRSAQSLPVVETQKLAPKDYLRDERLRNESAYSSHEFRARESSKWEEIWSDSSLSSSERLLEVHKEAQRLDSRAKRSEVLLNRMDTSWEKGAAASEAVSRLYLNSIKAKLAVLNAID